MGAFQAYTCLLRDLVKQGKLQILNSCVLARSMSKSFVVEIGRPHALSQNQRFDCLLPAVSAVRKGVLVHVEAEAEVNSIAKRSSVIACETVLFQKSRDFEERMEVGGSSLGGHKRLSGQESKQVAHGN
ncbi:hypothetical protein HG530_004992 [Fusarium avenaceum]|nr:hypothetical protein HG530_004992 [Fusarium avenaceum]